MPFYERWMNILFWCLCACVGIGGWMAWSGAEQQDSDFMVQGLIFAGVTGGVALMLLVIYLRRVQPIVNRTKSAPLATLHDDAGRPAYFGEDAICYRRKLCLFARGSRFRARLDDDKLELTWQERTVRADAPNFTVGNALTIPLAPDSRDAASEALKTLERRGKLKRTD